MWGGRGADCSSSGRFGVLSFLVTSVLEFTLLPYYQRNNGYTRFKNFSWCQSQRTITVELLHSIDPTFENGFYDIAVVHAQLNSDLLQKNSLTSVENRSYLISAMKKYQASGIEKIFISSIALNRGISAGTIKSVNEKINSLC